MQPFLLLHLPSRHITCTHCLAASSVLTNMCFSFPLPHCFCFVNIDLAPFSPHTRIIEHSLHRDRRTVDKTERTQNILMDMRLGMDDFIYSGKRHTQALDLFSLTSIFAVFVTNIFSYLEGPCVCCCNFVFITCGTPSFLPRQEGREEDMPTTPYSSVPATSSSPSLSSMSPCPQHLPPPLRTFSFLCPSHHTVSLHISVSISLYLVYSLPLLSFLISHACFSLGMGLPACPPLSSISLSVLFSSCRTFCTSCPFTFCQNGTLLPSSILKKWRSRHASRA